MRARARVLPGVSLGVATSARKFALFQLLLVETFSFLLTPPGASSSAATAAGVLLQRKLSRVDFEPPHPSHQRHRHHYHHRRRNGSGCRQSAHFSHHESWPDSPSHSHALRHQSRIPSRSVLVPFCYRNNSSES
ncbi:unnamed protein product, partial [Laminaria digitata]